MAEYDNLLHEKVSWRRQEFIIGADEAGRGALAGPIVGAAVIFNKHQTGIPPFITDSKKLTPQARSEACQWILNNCLSYYCVFRAPALIDAMNIDVCNEYVLKSSIMKAEEDAGIIVSTALIDGNMFVSLPLRIATKLLAHGELRSVSIAAASIVAKVQRDAYMKEIHEVHSVYGFDKHKGYGTPQHIKAMKEHGRCAMHRKTFRVKGVDYD